MGAGQHRVSLLVAAVLVAIAANASPAAQQWHQVGKLLPEDGGEVNFFGASVSISGDTTIIGAPNDDDNGYWSGSAYLFNALTGLQMTKLLPDVGNRYDRFGVSVAISGNTVIIGAEGDGEVGLRAGAAYLFDTVSHQQIAKLMADDGRPGDEFGNPVALHGTHAIIGVENDNARGRESGSVYQFDAITTQQIGKRVPGDGAARDFFGCAVAVSDNTVIVGAYWDDDNGPNSGSAYLYEVTSGRLIAKLLPDDGAPDDEFGEAVAIDGNLVIVGVNNDDDNGPYSGSAYVFDARTGLQLAKLRPDDGAAGDSFGTAVAISGNVALIGAPYDDDNGIDSGSVYLFDMNTGLQLAKLMPDDGAERDYFGRAVAIEGDVAIVGAEADDDNGFNSGSAYVFHRGPFLAAQGTCPGPMRFTASGMTAARAVAFVKGTRQGVTVIPPGNPCAGVSLRIAGGTTLARVIPANNQGIAHLDATVPSIACDNIYLQAIDLHTCATSNVVVVR